jgi:hypothetical protein
MARIPQSAGSLCRICLLLQAGQLILEFLKADEHRWRCRVGRQAGLELADRLLESLHALVVFLLCHHL